MNLQTKRFIDSFLGVSLIVFHLLLNLPVQLFRRKKENLPDPDHIIFIKILGVGSIFLASDTIYSTRKKYPGTKISVVTLHSFQSALEPIGLFDSIIPIKDKTFLQLITSSIKAFYTIWKMKNRWVVDLEAHSRLTTIFSFWAFPSLKMGFYNDLSSMRKRLFDKSVFFDMDVLVIKNYDALLESIGVTEKIFFHPDRYPPGRSGKKPDQIIINNTCTALSLERKLTQPMMVEILEYLLEKTKLKIILSGAPPDFNENEDLTRIVQNNRLENIAGKYSFSDWMDYIYRNGCCMISVDSAPLHIARKMGIPNLSIWGPTDPDHRLLYDDKHYPYTDTIYVKKACSPCVHIHNHPPCGGDNICIKDLDMKMIKIKLDKLIKASIK